MNREHAPEVYELVMKENPNFFEDFVKQPSIPSGGSVILSRLHDNNIVLIGDSAHAMVWQCFLAFLSSQFLVFNSKFYMEKITSITLLTIWQYSIQSHHSKLYRFLEKLTDVIKFEEY